ncbi:MAG: hypothetical protein HY909_18170 [Deltaproteobacteria bacterium]|nr:hypothetical protein [Deltaproteobacteria bacterium]
MTPRAALGASVALLALPARADTPLRFNDRGASALVLDGRLRDWAPVAELLAVDEPRSGASTWRGADDASFGFALARDDGGLWLAAEVRDDHLVRSRAHGPHDDALVLTLCLPSGARPVVRELTFLPGEPGAYAGVVRSNGRAIPSARIVEEDLPGRTGFTLEAFVPWGAMPEVRDGQASLRGTLGYRDADAGGGVTLVATGPGSAQSPALLPPFAGSVGTVGPANLLQRFQLDRGLGTVPPVFDRGVDLTGDRVQERVVVFPQYLLAFGPGIASGASYAWAELPSRRAEDVLETLLRDFNGDGRPDVGLRVRVSAGAFERELLLLYGLGAGGSLERWFAHELGRSSGASRLVNTVAYPAGGRLRMSFESVQGFTATTFPGATEAGVEPPLSPWGPARQRVYAWSAAARGFTLESQVANPAAPAAPAPSGPSAPLQPPAGAPDVTGVLALFRQREHVPEGARPEHRAVGDVAEDPTPEEVLVFGRVLLVVGTRYQGGRSYYTMTLPMSDGDTVLSVQLADLTGEGRAEACVRVRRATTARVQGTDLQVQRENLLVYSFEPPHRGRIFAAEVSRRVGVDTIENRVRMPPRGSMDLVLEAGTARGWTVANYPFHDQPSPGIAPLLLPWDATQRRVTYRWNGTAVERAP